MVQHLLAEESMNFSQKFSHLKLLYQTSRFHEENETEEHLISSCCQILQVFILPQQDLLFSEF